MKVSKMLVDILNDSGQRTDSIIDPISNWRSYYVSECDVKNKVTSLKNDLISKEDYDKEDIIDFLMDMEINQDDHNHNRKVLSSKCHLLESVIEFVIDNYDIDIRDIMTEFKSNLNIPGSRNPNQIITDDMWDKATAYKRRNDKLETIISKMDQ